MNYRMLHLTMGAQPDGVSCGPTCLQAVYRYYDNAIGLNQTIAEVPYLKTGGTLAVLLGCDALKRGYKSTLHSFNVHCVIIPVKMTKLYMMNGWGLPPDILLLYKVMILTMKLYISLIHMLHIRYPMITIIKRLFRIGCMHICLVLRPMTLSCLSLQNKTKVYTLFFYNSLEQPPLDFSCPMAETVSSTFN